MCGEVEKSSRNNEIIIEQSRFLAAAHRHDKKSRAIKARDFCF
jgi:hypothetical protein